MDYNEKPKDDIIKDMLELQLSFENLKKKYLQQEALIGDLKIRLSESEEKCRTAFMTSPDSVNINRLSDGLYVSVNEGFTAITGYEPEDVIGKTSLELNIWADPADREELTQRLKKEGKVTNFNARFRAKDGTFITGSMTATIISIEGEPHLLNVTRDITTTLMTEEALELEQMIFNSLMNNLPDHIYFKDINSRFIRNNKAHALSFGLDNPDQVVGKSDFDFFTEEAARAAYEDEQTVIRTGKPVIKEEKLTRKDNQVVWFHAMKLPLYNKLGKIIGTFGISRDITKQKYAEETLKHSEERFRSVAQSAHDAIITINYEGNVIGWNKGAENIFGYKEEDIIGEPLDLIIPVDYLKDHIKSRILLERRDTTYDPNRIVELNGTRKNGDNFPLELSLAEWETSEGRFFTGIVRDITSRKRTEIENRIIFEITRGVTTTSNLDQLLKLIHNSLGKVVYADNFFVALFDESTGLFSFPYFVDKYDTSPAPTSMGKSCTDYVFRTLTPFLFTEEEYNMLLEKGEVEPVGSPSPSWVGIPLQTPSRIVGVMVLQHYEKPDVYTENDVRLLMSIGSQIAVAIDRKRSEEEILEKNNMLVEMNAEKDKFFSIIAHDLRGPLSSFVLATQILTEELMTMDPEEMRDITLGMKTSAANIFSLLENLLEWSRLQRGVMDFVPERIKLEDDLRDCTELLSEQARSKNISVYHNVPGDMYAIADRHMLEAVVRNLVSNALKFTPSGGKVTIEAHYNDNKEVEIVIEDTGIGVPSNIKDKLFRINEKTNRKGTAGESSTGLGLLLCKEFVEKHKGRIWVESEEDQGSRFYFTIPGTR
ncbi:MAG TPA: PAS domain S-box protein [Bacteroidales bacterium]|nr:PAS domain S-box protein [Bacteroidales bacterium]